MSSFPLYGTMSILTISVLVALTNQYNTANITNYTGPSSSIEKRRRLMDGGNFALPPDNGDYSNIFGNKSIHRDKNTKGKTSLVGGICQGRGCGDGPPPADGGNLSHTQATNDRWATPGHFEFVNASDEISQTLSDGNDEDAERTADKSIIETQIQEGTLSTESIGPETNLRKEINRDNLITTSGNSSSRSGKKLTEIAMGWTGTTFNRIKDTADDVTPKNAYNDIGHVSAKTINERRLMDENGGQAAASSATWKLQRAGGDNANSAKKKTSSPLGNLVLKSQVAKRTFLPAKNQSITVAGINDGTTSPDPLSYGTGRPDKGPDRLTPSWTTSPPPAKKMPPHSTRRRIDRDNRQAFSILPPLWRSSTSSSAVSGEGAGVNTTTTSRTTTGSSLQSTGERTRELVDDNSDTRTFYFTDRTTTTPPLGFTAENAPTATTTTQLHRSLYSNLSGRAKAKTYGTVKYGKERVDPVESRLNDTFPVETRLFNKSSSTVDSVFPTDYDNNDDDIYNVTTGSSFSSFSTVTKSSALMSDDGADGSGNFSSEIGAGGVTNKVLQPEVPWPVKKEAVVEGDLVLGGLMMVHEREDTITCGPVMPQGGIQALEAMLYTLDRLNFAPDPLLPNVTIGAHILDDCDKDTYGLEMAVDFIKGSISNIDGAEYHCNKTQVRKVISGVVGAASSVTSIQVANLLRLFRIPQVSFFSTSPELSNKQRFEYFTRTIPSDHYQVKAMVDIVRLMGWSYISIIYEESNYGIKAFEELEDLLTEYNICIAVKEKLVKDSGVADESAYDNIVLKLLTKPRARGCIIFGSDQEVAGVMRAVRRSNATGSFSWIGSDGWSARSLVSDGNEAEVEGTLSVQPQANPVQGFEDYFLALNVENNPRNPWFVEFWEHHFQCRHPNSSKTPYNQKHGPVCTGKEKLSRQNTVFEDQLQFVSDAVMAFAYAIRDMHKDLCHGRPGLCDVMKPTKGTELLKYLRKVDFEGLSGDRFHFDSNGDGPARYNIIHFKQVSTGKYRWIRVGEYIEGELRLNMSEIQFKLGHPKPPESVCSFPCDLGQAKKYVEGESCCWHCFNCTQYQIRHPIDPTQCVSCPQGTVPDPHHVRCTNIPEEYLRPDSGWAIGAMALSSTGILITMFVCGVFVRHNDTPVVRASGRELSYVLLAGILMCYGVTYALVLRPNDIVCGIQRFGAGFCFTVVYAALLTKTNRISRIFNAGKHSAKRPSFISPRSQLIICSGLVGVQVIVNGVWMVISPARAIHHYPTREDNLLVCSSYIDASYMIAFTYPIFLIVVCTVYAVLTRKIPEAFNESKHIGFTMYTTCVIWLAFVPLYFGTANHVALRITSMSVTISLSASVTVACLFSPKLYIILIRPERNVRQSMMPMRYSAINKSSATTGSGSMMAAVMVTAATCDQKQQIQKHVPPIEKEEETDLSDSKSKPQMKDTSTQTTPNSGNDLMTLNNSSQEHLPKINNNCNVGNGPIALLPGVQIKDL